MDDLLRRSLAPIADSAWEAIDAEARNTLRTHLSGRSIVDVTEPRGWTAAVVNLGRLGVDDEHTIDGVTWGHRLVQPLIEVRVPFVLDQMEIDNIVRGAEDANLDPLVDAAKKIAAFEEKAIYCGFKKGQIRGISKCSPHKPISLSEDTEHITISTAEAVKQLQVAGIDGPYALVLPAGPFHALMQSTRTGFPLAQVLHELLEGEIYWSPGVDTGIVISMRGGDFQLTLGQDLAIGYASHNRDQVELYFTESFSFSVFEGAAAVALPVVDGDLSFERERNHHAQNEAAQSTRS